MSTYDVIKNLKRLREGKSVNGQYGSKKMRESVIIDSYPQRNYEDLDSYQEMLSNYTSSLGSPDQVVALIPRIVHAIYYEVKEGQSIKSRSYDMGAYGVFKEGSYKGIPLVIQKFDRKVTYFINFRDVPQFEQKVAQNLVDHKNRKGEEFWNDREYEDMLRQYMGDLGSPSEIVLLSEGGSDYFRQVLRTPIKRSESTPYGTFDLYEVDGIKVIIRNNGSTADDDYYYVNRNDLVNILNRIYTKGLSWTQESRQSVSRSRGIREMDSSLRTNLLIDGITNAYRYGYDEPYIIEDYFNYLDDLNELPLNWDWEDIDELPNRLRQLQPEHIEELANRVHVDINESRKVRGRRHIRESRYDSAVAIARKLGITSVRVSSEHQPYTEAPYPTPSAWVPTYYGYATLEHKNLGQFTVSYRATGRKNSPLPKIPTSGRPWGMLQNTLTLQQIKFIESNEDALWNMIIGIEVSWKDSSIDEGIRESSLSDDD